MAFILMLIVAGFPLFFGVMFIRNHNNLVKVCTVKTDGQVVEYQEETKTERYLDEDGDERTRTSTMYYPVFKYSADGRDITNTGNTGTSRRRLRVGQKVSVFYNPTNPEQFYAAEDFSTRKLGIFLIVLGVIILLAGLVLSIL